MKLRGAGVGGAACLVVPGPEPVLLEGNHVVIRGVPTDLWYRQESQNERKLIDGQSERLQR